MSNKTKRSLINQLLRVSNADSPITIKHKGKALAVVVPIENCEKFLAEREGKLELLKKEFDGILALVRSCTGRQTIEEVEARLAALRQEIEQEME